MTKRRMKFYDRALVFVSAVAIFNLTENLYSYGVIMFVVFSYAAFNFCWGLDVGCGRLDE